MKPVIREPIPVQTSLDSDLLLAIAAGDADERRAAAEVFYRRHAPALHHFCKQFATSLGEFGINDLVLMTMQKAFASGDSYRPSELNARDLERGQTTRWLYKIARNVFYDFLRDQGQTQPVPLSLVGTMKQGQSIEGRFVSISDEEIASYEDVSALMPFDDGEDVVENLTSPARACLEAALQRLSEREREVLLLSAMYMTGEKQLRLPSDVLDGICARWKTSQQNIRAIRRRSLDSVRKYAAEHCAPFLSR